MPQELATWRAARTEVSHDLIERTLLLFISELGRSTHADDTEIREKVIQLWEECVKLRITAVIEGAQKVLSPRMLLSPIVHDEEMLARFETVACESPLLGGASLSLRIAKVKEAALTVDAAICKLREISTPEVVQAAQRAVSALRAALQNLPTSPVIP